MTFLQRFITGERDHFDSMATLVESFDLYDHQNAEDLLATFADKSACDKDGRHLGFVNDVMISTWNNKPLYVVLDVKIKPWHMRSEQFYYPIASVTSLDSVKVTLKDQRVTIYESPSFDPKIIEIQESYPLLSLKCIVDSEILEETETPINYHRAIASSDFWSSGLW